MDEITGAQIIVESLKREGVEVIFGYPGGQAIPIFDAMYSASEIKIVLTRHEQAAVHAAEGYAKSTGKVGVVLVTSGPGATNTVTGLADANFDSVPIVCLCGQVPSSMIGIDAFQEADITGITNGVTKHNYLVHNVSELAETIKNSFYIARTGRPGPVLIDVPKDVSISKHEFNYDFDVNIRGYKPHIEGNVNQIKKAAQMIELSKKPVIIVGGGLIISESADEVRELAVKCDIPVTSTLLGLGSVEFDAPYFLGMHGMHGTVGANKAIQESDLIIALGSRFDDRATGKLSTFAPHAKIIHVNIDSASISKNVQVDIPVVGDLKDILKKLLSVINKMERKEWMAIIAEYKKLTHEIPRNKKRLTSIEVMEAINNNVPEDTIVTTDVGQHQMWTAMYYKFKYPRSFITSGGLGTMGFGFPAAIGAQIANPGQRVLCVTGDGSFQMNLQELATAVVEDLPVIIVIMNNGYLGMVRQWQELFFDKRYSSTCLMKCKHRNAECGGDYEKCVKFLPDFVKLADSYGAVGIRVKTKEELDAAFKKALETKDTPVIIDVITEREENVWPMVPAGASLDEVLKGGMTA
jgi:acetolactate synthase I/II/III large subunit